MARKPKSISVYERIENVKDEIINKEKELANLRQQLQELYKEKDDLEMHQIFELIKSNGLTIDKAKELLQSNNK